MLANRQDMRWPLSTNFDKLISRTADKGQAQYALGSAGLLTGGKTYYWRVQAKNDKGVWGPWSKTWSFTPTAPNYPLEVAVLGYDNDKAVGTLKWKANPFGQKPVKYRVYGSNETGFSVSDVPYRVNVGLSKELQPEFLTQLHRRDHGATELAVMGDGSPVAQRQPDVLSRGGRRRAGRRRSGPLRLRHRPAPTIYGTPATQAKVGTEYRRQLQANRLLGDLRLRIVNGKEAANFWDIEKPMFAIAQGPAWLKIDPATGLLSGTPVAAGKIDVAVTVTIDQEVRKLDDNTLGWGVEKVVSTSTERVGSCHGDSSRLRSANSRPQKVPSGKPSTGSPSPVPLH